MQYFSRKRGIRFKRRMGGETAYITVTLRHPELIAALQKAHEKRQQPVSKILQNFIIQAFEEGKMP